MMMMVLMMTKTTRRLKNWTLVGVWELLTTVSTVVESCSPKQLFATPSFQPLIYNGSSEPPCAWVIQGPDEGDVIGIRVIDWITPSGFSCSRDRLNIRDGSHSSSPFLRVLCGAMCGVLNDDTEIVTSSNSMRVVYIPFDQSALQQRGFTLVYRSRTIHPVERQTAMYTGVNYVLMCASVLVIGGLTTGLVYLFLRELGLLRLKRRQDMIDKLKRRRPGFSGQSGVQNRRRRAGQGTEPVDTPRTPLTHTVASSQLLFTASSEIPEDKVENESSADCLPAEPSPPSDRTHDDVTRAPSPGDDNHVLGNGNVASFASDAGQARCNGRVTSPGRRGTNHVPCVAEVQTEMPDVIAN